MTLDRDEKFGSNLAAAPGVIGTGGKKLLCVAVLLMATPCAGVCRREGSLNNSDE